MRRREYRQLFVAEPDGTYVPAPDSIVIRAATEAVKRALARGPSMSSPKAARQLLPALLGPLEYEVFCVAYLDNRHRLIHFEELFRGTVDTSAVHAREIVKGALKWNSSALVVVHNHPSGQAEASLADERITTLLKEALALVGCRLLDHLIVGGDQVCSMAERGQM